MVGVHVADDDAGQLPRVVEAGEAVGHAMSGVEQDDGLFEFDQEARRRRIRVGECVAASDHVQPQTAGQGSHRRILRRQRGSARPMA
jgi:hypothetical protein